MTTYCLEAHDVTKTFQEGKQTVDGMLGEIQEIGDTMLEAGRR